MASSKELSSKIGSVEKLQNRFVEIFGKEDVQLFDVDAIYERDVEKQRTRCWRRERVQE